MFGKRDRPTLISSVSWLSNRKTLVFFGASFLLVTSTQFPRPTILLVEPESTDMISARKLVLETAKFNVLNAYSTGEALMMFEKFKSVDAIVVHAEVIDSERLALAVKQQRRDLPVIGLRPSLFEHRDHTDHQISSHSPEELLSLLRSKFGDPRRLAVEQKH
jgi:CheY-like chemotaxis protein